MAGMTRLCRSQRSACRPARTGRPRTRGATCPLARQYAWVLALAERRAEALQASAEAVALSRAIEPHQVSLLADSLASHALSPSSTGIPLEAMSISAESVDLYRGLAATGEHLFSDSLPMPLQPRDPSRG